MSKFFSRPRHWLIVLFSAIALFGSSAPTAQGQMVEPVPEWLAAAISVNFAVVPAQVKYTVYGGKNGPQAQTATILKLEETDITSTCTYYGSFGAPDANGYLPFDGVTNYIKCDAPGIADKWNALYPTIPLESPMTCDGGAPLFASADVKLASGTRSNPIIFTPDIGLGYSLPRTLNQARSQLFLGGNVTSAAWTPLASGNQLLAGGWNGPGMIAAASKFGWLNYLNAGWVPAYKPLMGTSLRHWYQSPNMLTTLSSPISYPLGTGPHEVYIGHNPADGSYFKGSLRQAVFDPGCPAS